MQPSRCSATMRAGVMAALHPRGVRPRRNTARSSPVPPVSAIALDGTCLRGKCEANAELGYQLLKRVTTVMYQRLQSTRVRLLDLYGTESVRA